MDTPRIVKKGCYKIEEEPGKKAWCSCGLSESDPFCDGSHSECDLRPVVVEITEKKLVAWCGCKHTKTPPWCDGSHRDL